MTKNMKELVAAIEVEENGYYMAPGRRIEAAQIAPSAWKKKPTIAADTTATPVAIRAELKRTEDMLSTSMQNVMQQMTNRHEEQLRLIQEQHQHAMQVMTKKFDDLTVHAEQQGEMIAGLLERNDNDQQQMTEGFEQMNNSFAANEKTMESLFRDVVKMQETSSKDRHTVVKAMQQNMETTAQAFRIITEELNTIHNDVEFMSEQSKEMEASFNDTAIQVNTIFDSFVLQRGEHNRHKRERSRSVSSRTTVGTIRRFRKKHQRDQAEIDLEFDNVSSVGQRNSDEDIGMDDLTEGDENDDFESPDNIDVDRTQTQDSSSTQEATLVSESPQGVSSRRD